jgi:Domain of unknown function (DUF4190)
VQYPPPSGGASQPDPGPPQSVPGYTPLNPNQPYGPPQPPAPPGPGYFPPQGGGYFPPQAPQYFPQQPGPVVVRVDPAATWSMWLGILTWAGFVETAGMAGLCFIPAIIMGHIALGRIKRSEGTLGGRGRAIAGLVLGYSFIGLGLLAVVVAVIVALGYRATHMTG